MPLFNPTQPELQDLAFVETLLIVHPKQTVLQILKNGGVSPELRAFYLREKMKENMEFNPKSRIRTAKLRTAPTYIQTAQGEVIDDGWNF